MNILAVDQATNQSGWCCLDSDKNIIKFGIIDLSKLPKSTDQDQAEKRYQFIAQMREIIFTYKIQQVISEGVYFFKNPETHRKLAQWQGCLQDFCRNNEISCFSWANAGEWRGIIGIKGSKREEYKEATKQYIISNYGLPNDLAEDIYDSVGIGAAYFKLLKRNE